MTTSMELHSLAEKRWDAIVIGAGPAGSIAAHGLATRGRSVLVLERARFPRSKVCGGCLNLRAMDVLTGVGLSDCVWNSGAIPLNSFAVGAGGRQATISLPGGAALSRGELDAALLDAARAAGATAIEGVRAVWESHGDDVVRVRVGSNDEERLLEARACIVASGLAHDTLKFVSGIRTHISPSTRLGAGALLESDCNVYEPRTIYMAVGRNGYVGLVRVENNLLNMAAAFDPAFLRECGTPHIATQRVLEHAWFAVPDGLDSAIWRGTPPLTRRVRPTALHRLLIVGDAAGYIEPFTGEGMAWALESGRAASAFVHNSLEDWSEAKCAAWEREHHRRLARAQRRCRAIAAGLRHPLLTAAGIHTLRVAPAIARPFVKAINAPPTHREYAP